FNSMSNGQEATSSVQSSKSNVQLPITNTQLPNTNSSLDALAQFYTRAGAALISEASAQRFGLKIGDTITLLTELLFPLGFLALGYVLVMFGFKLESVKSKAFFRKLFTV